MTSLTFRTRTYTASCQVEGGRVDFEIRVRRDGDEVFYDAIAWDLRNLAADDVEDVARLVAIGPRYKTLEHAIDACEAALPVILARAPKGGLVP